MLPPQRTYLPSISLTGPTLKIIAGYTPRTPLGAEHVEGMRQTYEPYMRDPNIEVKHGWLQSDTGEFHEVHPETGARAGLASSAPPSSAGARSQQAGFVPPSSVSGQSQQAGSGPSSSQDSRGVSGLRRGFLNPNLGSPSSSRAADSRNPRATPGPGTDP